MIYLVSDSHIGHEKLTEWGKRKGDWRKEILSGLSKLNHDDILIHLGDLCFGDYEANHAQLISSIPCTTKILIVGNHDRKGNQWYLYHGWSFVVDMFSLTHKGEEILFTHRPFKPDIWRWNKNIHGHTHGVLFPSEDYTHEGWYTDGFHIDISPEIVGYKPLSLDEVLKL